MSTETPTTDGILSTHDVILADALAKQIAAVVASVELGDPELRILSEARDLVHVLAQRLDAACEQLAPPAPIAGTQVPTIEGVPGVPEASSG